METIVGIGPDGCRIADEFAKYPQYDVYKISTGISGEKCFELQEKNTPEEYESSVPDLTQLFADVSDDVLFVVGGGSKISGASLQIMKYVKDKNIHVLYKRPVLTDLNRTSLLQEKLTYNVFQEYARSGIFKKLFVVSEESVEEIIGDVSILDFKNAVDKQIVNVVHYTNVFQNIEAILDNSEPPKDIARICTFGIQDMQSGEEKQFFNLQNVCDKIYFFAIKEDDLKSDKKLIKNIREQLSKNDVRPSYQVHSTKHPQSFCYFISYSSRIQEG